MIKRTEGFFYNVRLQLRYYIPSRICKCQSTSQIEVTAYSIFPLNFVDAASHFEQIGESWQRNCVTSNNDCQLKQVCTILDVETFDLKRYSLTVIKYQISPCRTKVRAVINQIIDNLKKFTNDNSTFYLVYIKFRSAFFNRVFDLYTCTCIKILKITDTCMCKTKGFHSTIMCLKNYKKKIFAIGTNRKRVCLQVLSALKACTIPFSN